MSNKEKECTLKDLGFSFTWSEGCQSCGDNGCHNVVNCNVSGKNFEIHLKAIPESGTYEVTVFDYDNNNEILLEKTFNSNIKTAMFLCDTYGFTCA